MLTLIGLGVCGDITENGLKSINKADEIYYEPYTLIYPEDAKQRILNRFKPIELPRSKVESKFLINKAKDKNIVLLVGGDPLIATTHVSLMLDCEQMGVKCNVIHNSSIYSAGVGKSGLQAYKFGKTVTLVNPRENYKPTSSINLIKQNLKLGMHTLVLLDTEPKPMDAKTAIEMLKSFDKLIILSHVGCKDEKIAYGMPANLLNHLTELGSPPFTVIVPAKLHFLEEDFLETFLID